MTCEGRWGMRPRAALAMAVLASVVPCLVAAQQSTGHRIGQLGPGPTGCAFAPSDAAKGTPYEGQPLHPFEVALRLGLRDSGWIDPDKLHIERRCYQTVDQLATMAEDLAGLRLEAIIAFTTSAMLILKQKGGRVPIVFIDALDPVGTGFVTSLARPGGNMTGLSGMFGELVAKRIELLRELVPGIKRLGLLSDDPIYAKIMADAADGGRPFNITTHSYFAERPDDPQYHCNLGLVLESMERLADAEASQRTALSLRPDYPDAYNNLGLALSDLGEFAAAVQAYTQAITIDAHDWHAYNNRGLALWALGRREDARRDYAKAKELIGG